MTFFQKIENGNGFNGQTKIKTEKRKYTFFWFRQLNFFIKSGDIEQNIWVASDKHIKCSNDQIFGFNKKAITHNKI